MDTDIIISENIRIIIKENYGTVSNLAKKLKISPQALNDSIADIKKGKYPSIKKLKKIAQTCNCDITDFFKMRK